MKKWFLLVIPLLLIAGLIFVFLAPSSKEPQEEVKKEKETPKVFPIDQLTESERPEVTLTARPDGKELTLKIENLKNIKTVEYELTYLTEGVQRGVIGTVQVEVGENSLTRDLLLGTCSRGVCRYDKNVTGGTLTVTFRGEKTYKFVKDFTLETEKGKTVVVME